MQRLGRVRFLKAVEGVPDPGGILGGVRRVARPMQRMFDAIGGTDDAVALYIKANPRERYNPAVTASAVRRAHRPEHIAAVLWLGPHKERASVSDHTEDEQYEIGCPVAAVDTSCGPRLKDLVLRIYGADADDVWRRLRGSLTGGKPFRIDEGDYSRLGDELTAFYSAVASTTS